MLKRISTIKNIGAFKDCNASPVAFDKITLVYGRNTYGKSTLGDIFASLKSGNPQNLVARKSIPDDQSPQKIEMGFATNGENEGQGKAIFRNGNWTNGLRASHSLAVYDDGFYHSHVFTARSLTRGNKENFSNFVLGEQGVEKAQLIEVKSQERGQKNRRKTAMEKEVFSGIEGLQDFLQQTVVEDINGTKEALEKARQDYVDLLKQKKQSTEIKARSKLSPISLDRSLIDGAEAINTVLATQLENQHEAAKAELENHIKRHFTKIEGAEQWIQQGLGYITRDKGNGDKEIADNCAFCGQSLTPEVNELLDIYKQCFDDQYARHEGFVSSSLKRIRPQLTLNLLQTLTTHIEQTDLVIQAYPELSEQPEAKTVIDTIKAVHQKIQGQLDPLRAVGDGVIEKFNEIIPLKLAGPDKAVATVDLDDLKAVFDSIGLLTTALNTEIATFNQHIEAFKATLENGPLEQQLATLKEKGIALGKDVQRYEKNDACIEYQQLLTDINSLERDIPRLRDELAEEQNTYLAQYFDIINRYFRALGSRDFTLQHGTNNQGKKPVNYFKVQFRGQPVAEADLDKVFSESDRRSLGLAIFLSSLDSMEPADLARTVVVLDDPVTSFDDHRVGQTHSKLVELADRCEQIILLSHFKEGVANFLNVHGFSRTDVRVIEIIRDAQGSKLQVADADAFIKSAHQQNTDELIDFVERRTDKLSCKPRVYLEDVIQIRFAKQIRAHAITNNTLSERIDALKTHGILSADIGQQLHRWRNELNPEHHVWLGDDIENQRNTVAEFLEFVFHQLIPAA
ncbi:AAA family ATPase [Motiliproteus sp. MSK22-1]|uniref:AAA family ATPase n=1 Tax=Motiliproteus sp. MSK22-1 TaxID=1897630 RepID=UPI0009779248|nr:AAA family ATPase [Motiliproteus sp. MSK22-1]OMH39416.1 hypothetical protein BGP75_03660 [Motiliproteus sp. MSK22-1]